MQLVLVLLSLTKPAFTGGMWATYDYFGGALTDTSRPPHRVEVGLNGNLSLWAFSLNLQLLFNSDDRFAPQATSMYGIHPTWSWGRLYFGDFTPSFSPTILSGMAVQGYGVDLFPGPFRLFFLTGRARATAVETLSVKVDRRLQGVLVELGRSRNLGLTWLQVRDPDLQGLSITPEGNWILGMKFKMAIRRLTVRVEGSGSVHTRDLSLGRSPFERIPAFLTQRLVLNESSHADYAYQIEMAWKLRRLGMKVKRMYIGPGYVSLGVPSLHNDRLQHEGMLNLAFREGRTSLVLQGRQQMDNLVNTKDGTTRNLQGSLTLTSVVGRNLRWSTGVMASQLEKTGDTLILNLSNQILTALLSVSYSKQQGTRTWMMTATYHWNSVSTQAGSVTRRTQIHTGSLSLRVRPFWKTLGLLVSVDNLLRRDTTLFENSVRMKLSLEIRGQGARPWTVASSFTWNQTPTAGVFGVETTGNVDLSPLGSLRLRAYVQQRKATESNRQVRLTLGLQRRFR